MRASPLPSRAWKAIALTLAFGLTLSASPALAATYQVGPGKQYANLGAVAGLLAPVGGDELGGGPGLREFGGVRFASEG